MQYLPGTRKNMLLRSLRNREELFMAFSFHVADSGCVERLLEIRFLYVPAYD